MWDFTAGDAVRKLTEVIGRTVDVVVVNVARPSSQTLARYGEEHKLPLEVGDIPPYCELVIGDFWCGEIARHDRRRLAHAVCGPRSAELL